MKDYVYEELLEKVAFGELSSGVISSPLEKDSENVFKVSIRPIKIKQKIFYQISNHYRQKVVHCNLSFEECIDLIRDFFPRGYRQGVFLTENASYHVLVNKKKELTVIKKNQTLQVIDLSHNRIKKHVLAEGKSIPFLIHLGIMTPEGKVVAKKYDKFRQINRFVEVVSDVIEHLPKDRTIEVVDFGCGKASLTFALYHYLHNIEKREVNITGLDLKKDVIEHCQSVATAVGFNNLKFSVGDINKHQAQGKIDLVISLHACNTATDAAIEKAVKWNADVILSVPCCQHELYSQVENEDLSTLLRHGILKERFAALATDAARAELLTIVGYDVQILEFIDMEHTPKNLLIRAINNPSLKKQQQAKERYHYFKQALHIEPSLEKMLFK